MARLVLTQPLPRGLSLARSLESRGHEVLGLPFTRIQTLRVPDLANRLGACGCVVAVSPAAVEALAELVGEAWPKPGPAIGLIGPGSLAALQAGRLAAIEAPIIAPLAPPYDAQSLIAMPEFAPGRLRKVLVVRGDTGREDWIRSLRGRGTDVEVLALYTREPMEPALEDRQTLVSWLENDTPLYCLFTQTDAVRALCALPEASRLTRTTAPRIALTIHQRIAEAAREAGFSRVIVIDPGESSIAAAIE